LQGLHKQLYQKGNVPFVVWSKKQILPFGSPLPFEYIWQPLEILD